MYVNKRKPKKEPLLAADVLLLLERLCNATKGGFRGDPDGPEEDFCANSPILSKEAYKRIPRHLGLRYDPTSKKNVCGRFEWDIIWDKDDVPLYERLSKQGVKAKLNESQDDRNAPGCVHVDIEDMDMCILVQDGAVHLFDYQRV